MNPTDINTIVAAYRQNPQALQQKYAMSQDLLDLLALQKITKEKQDAARQMQLQAGQQGMPPPVAQQLEGEALDMTKQELAQQSAGIANQRAGEMQQRMQGIASMPAPNMQAFAGGGIIGFSGEQGSYVVPDVDPNDLYKLSSTPQERKWNPPLTEGESLLKQDEALRNRGPASGTSQQDTIVILQKEYRDAVARKDQELATALLAEMRTVAATGRMSGARSGEPSVKKEPPYSEPIQIRNTQKPPTAAMQPSSAQDPLRVQEARAGISQKPYLTNAQLVDAAQRQALEMDPEAERQRGRSQYDTEVGNEARAAYDARTALYKQGLEGIQALQQKRLAAGEGVDKRPEWLQGISAMANAYDPKKGPAGLAGLAAVNTGTDVLNAAKVKKEQDRAQLELDFATQVQEYVRKGWPIEDAKLKVAAEKYEAGETSAKTARATKAGAVKEEMDLRQAKERVLSGGAGAMDRTQLAKVNALLNIRKSDVSALQKKMEQDFPKTRILGKADIAAKAALQAQIDAAQQEISQLEQASIFGGILPTVPVQSSTAPVDLSGFNVRSKTPTK